MKLLDIDMYFHDATAIKLAGIDLPQNPMRGKCIAGAMPRPGDVVADTRLSYADGERGRFLVKTVAHMLGNDMPRIQLNLQLVVLHQP